MSVFEHVIPEIDRRISGWPYLLVGLGGAAGALVRYGVSEMIPGKVWGISLFLVIINIVGAFLLGLLYSSLSKTPADAPRRHTLTLFLGTGFMGAFTTYSEFAQALSKDLLHGQILDLLVGAIVVVGAGVLGALAGYYLGQTILKSTSATRKAGQQ